LEIKINDVSTSEKELEATFTYEEIKKDLETEVLKETKKVQIPGFRKGKVPPALLKKMFGDTLEQEASEKVANKKFWDLVEEKQIHPVGKPSLIDIKYTTGESLFIKIAYEIIPVIEVKDYKGLEIEIPDLLVKDEDVDHEVSHILKANQIQEPVDEVNDEKNCIIDVEMQRLDKDGAQLPDSKPGSLQIDLANNGIAPEIIENSKGKKVGESFNFTFNEDRSFKTKEGLEEKVNETYYYSAKINGIKKASLPAIDETFIKKVTKDKVSTEAEFRDQIKNDIQQYFDNQMEEILRGKLMTEIIKNNDFKPPLALVNNFIEDYMKNEEEQYKKQGYKKYDKTEARNRLFKSAENEVKWYILKDAIKKQENISLSDEELNELAAKDAEQTGIAIEKLINYYKSSNYAEKFVENKVFDFLKSNNNVKKVEPDKTLTHNHEEHNHE
jgi:trigger factor